MFVIKYIVCKLSSSSLKAFFFFFSYGDKITEPFAAVYGNTELPTHYVFRVVTDE